MNELPNDFFCDTAIEKAVDHIRAGQLIAFPTETVYGLGADATNASAVATIFAVKDRPSFNPLIIHVADAKVAEELVIFDDRARALAEIFWPSIGMARRTVKTGFIGMIREASPAAVHLIPCMNSSW